MVQPPTFVGDSGVGYAVTADGDLVRFDLQDPAAGAVVVFSGPQVRGGAGPVERAGRGGAGRRDVSLLDPRATASRWLGARGRGGIAALPSSIDVLNKASGRFDVLVSSQGSDTIFVYAQGAAFGGSAAHPEHVSSSPASSRSGPRGLHAEPVLPPDVQHAHRERLAGVGVGQRDGIDIIELELGVRDRQTATTVGLSLGGFSSLGNGSTRGDGGTILVPVKGNTYLSVPILDFGPGSDGDGMATGAHALARRPGIASATSPT